MRDLIYIRLVDLDKSMSNKIVIEESTKSKSFECPHHIIVGIIKIVGEFIKQRKNNEEPSILQKKVDTEQLLESHKDYIMKALIKIKEELREEIREMHVN